MQDRDTLAGPVRVDSVDGRMYLCQIVKCICLKLYKMQARDALVGPVRVGSAQEGRMYLSQSVKCICLKQEMYLSQILQHAGPRHFGRPSQGGFFTRRQREGKT